MSDQETEKTDAPVFVKEAVGLLAAYMIYTTGCVPGYVEVDGGTDEEGLEHFTIDFALRPMPPLAHAEARSGMNGAKLSTRNAGPALLELAKRSARGIDDHSNIVTQ